MTMEDRLSQLIAELTEENENLRTQLENAEEVIDFLIMGGEE